MVRTTDPTKQTIRRLQKTILGSNRDNKSLYIEMAERGKELVKISQLVEGWRTQIPEVLFNNFMGILNEFTMRCSEKQTKLRMLKKYGKEG